MKRETLLAILISLIVLFLANFYIFFGLLFPKDNMVFLGRHVINADATYTYVSFIEQARTGRLLFENLYDPQPQTPSLFRPSYLFLGKFSQITNISPLITYHIGRVFFSAIFMAVLYLFLGLFFENRKDKLLSFAFVLTSSGLGYILVGLFPNSIDRWIPESITFLSLGEAPHFPLSQALMIGIFYCFLKGLSSSNKLYYLVLVFCLLLLSFEHPFNVPVIVLTIILTGGYFLFKKHQLGSLSRKNVFWAILAVVFSAFAGISYQVYEVFKNPILRSWNLQNILPSPNLLNISVGYGLILPFSVVGLLQYRKKKSPKHFLIVFWVFSTMLLLYSPITFQRRFSEGLHIPLAILSTVGIIETGRYLSKFIKTRSKSSVEYSFAIFILMIAMLGLFGNIYDDISAIASDTQSQYYYHILNSEYDAMIWLKNHSNSDDLILSNVFYGNILPGISGRKVYVGHNIQTPNIDKKVLVAASFLQTKNTNKAQSFLKDNKITYIYFGKNDDMLKSGYKPGSKSYLHKVYTNGGVEIYKVQP